MAEQKHEGTVTDRDCGNGLENGCAQWVEAKHKGGLERRFCVVTAEERSEPPSEPFGLYEDVLHQIR